ncbi:MAG: hypothetical protein FWF88_09145 [Peptococcaceae bacterium]|nr:hypothetical protein [Peptococcaceae bacterium]
MDYMVQQTQIWLNETYGGNSGYNTVTPGLKSHLQNLPICKQMAINVWDVISQEETLRKLGLESCQESLPEG